MGGFVALMNWTTTAHVLLTFYVRTVFDGGRPEASESVPSDNSSDASANLSHALFIVFSSKMWHDADVR